MSEWDEELVEATLRDHAEPTNDWRDEQICIHDETPEWPCAELRLARIATALRAQLAHRDEELAALREKVRGVYELVTLFDYTAVYDLKSDILAALSDDQEGRDE